MLKSNLTEDIIESQSSNLILSPEREYCWYGSKKLKKLMKQSVEDFVNYEWRRRGETSF